MGETVEQIAKGQLVRIAVVGIGFEVGEKGICERANLPRQISSERLLQVFESVIVGFKKNPGRGTHPLPVARVKDRRVVHEHDCLAVRRHAVVHGSKHRGGACCVWSG